MRNKMGNTNTSGVQAEASKAVNGVDLVAGHASPKIQEEAPESPSHDSSSVLDPPVSNAASDGDQKHPVRTDDSFGEDHLLKAHGSVDENHFHYTDGSISDAAGISRELSRGIGGDEKVSISDLDRHLFGRSNHIQDEASIEGVHGEILDLGPHEASGGDPLKLAEGEQSLGLPKMDEIPEIETPLGIKENDHSIRDQIAEHVAKVVPLIQNQDIDREKDELFAKESSSVEYTSSSIETLEMLCDIMSNGSKDHKDDKEVPFEINSIVVESVGSPMEDNPEIDSMASISDPQERTMLSTEENKLKLSESETREDNHNVESPKHLANDMPILNFIPSVAANGTYSQENGEENCKFIEVMLAENENQTYERNHLEDCFQELCKDIEGVIELVPEVGLIHNKSTTGSINEEEKGKEAIFLPKECIFGLPIAHAETDTKGGAEVSATHLESFLLSPDAPKAVKGCNLQHSSLDNCSVNEAFMTETSLVHLSEASKQKHFSEHDKAGEMKGEHRGLNEAFPWQDVETMSKMMRDAAKLPNLSHDQQYAAGDAIELAKTCSKTLENAGRLSMETNPELIDHPGDQVELRKSSSFNFGIPLDARSEESDQTPLLRYDQTTISTSSTNAIARFSSTFLPDQYGRNSYETEEVEEKTIRMERSDSHVIKLDQEKIDLALISEKKGLDNSGSSPQIEAALTSSRGIVRRKPKPSFLTSCMCCTASIQ